MIPCYQAFVTVDPNGTGWYIPKDSTEDTRRILPLNDSASSLYSQSCASVAIIGTTPQSDATLAMQTLEQNNFFANDTCKLMTRVVTENSVRPLGQEPTTCNTIFHWGLASSGASRSGMSSFCTNFKLSGMLSSSGEKFLTVLFLAINIYYDVLEIREDMREVPDMGYLIAVLGSGRGFRYLSYLSAVANMALILYILSLGSSTGIPDFGTRFGVGAQSAFQLCKFERAKEQERTVSASANSQPDIARTTCSPLRSYCACDTGGESGVVALNSPLRLLMPLHALYPTVTNAVSITCFIGAGGLLGLIPRQSQLALVPNLLRWAVREFLPLGLMMCESRDERV